MAGCTATHNPRVVRVIQDAPPISKAWSEGNTTTYWLGRMVVGSDGRVIHEAHPAYRREDAGRPQLAAPAEALMPPNTPAPSTNAVFEQFEVLRSENARARDLALQLARASSGLAEQMKSGAERTRQMQEQLQQLLESARALSNRVAQLERRITPTPPRAKP